MKIRTWEVPIFRGSMHMHQDVSCQTWARDHKYYLYVKLVRPVPILSDKNGPTGTKMVPCLAANIKLPSISDLD